MYGKSSANFQIWYSDMRFFYNFTSKIWIYAVEIPETHPPNLNGSSSFLLIYSKKKLRFYELQKK